LINSLVHIMTFRGNLHLFLATVKNPYTCLTVATGSVILFVSEFGLYQLTVIFK